MPFWLKKLTFSSGQLALTDSETLEEVLECLVENFSIETQGHYDQQICSVQSELSLSYIHQDYRKRFGIESSYRLKNLSRIRTNNNPLLRLLFVGISFLLVNIWVNLLWLKISRPRRGCRLIYRKLFGFKQMLAFLCQVVERKYQVVQGIYLPAD